MTERRFTPRSLLGLAKSQGIAFMAVGAFNTLLGYLLYYLLLTQAGLPYLGALVLAYAGAMLVAFTLHRVVVFRVSGNTAQDLARFVLVNLAALALNAALLPVAVEILGLDPVLAQIIVGAIVVAATFVGHRSFSFRRPNHS